MKLPKLQDKARAIPDTQNCGQPEKRVLDALKQAMTYLYDWARNASESQDRPNEGPEADLRTKIVQGNMIKVEPLGRNTYRVSFTGKIQEPPRYEGVKSIALLEGNKFQLVNDETAPGNSMVYATTSSGDRQWMTSTQFINNVLGDALKAYLDSWMTAWILENTVVEWITQTCVYSEGTRIFSNLLRKYRVFSAGEIAPSNVFTAEDCPPE